MKKYFTYGKMLLVLLFLVIGCSKEKEIFQGDNASSTQKRALTGSKDFYYWYKGKKIGVNFSKKAFYFSSTDLSKVESHEMPFGSRQIKKISEGKVEIKGKKAKYWKIVEIDSSLDWKQISKLDKSKYLIDNMAPVIISNDSILTGTSELFYVKIKTDQEKSILESFARTSNCSVIGNVPNMPLWFILESSSQSTGIEMSNIFYESGLFADVDPAFMFRFRPNCISDPQFSQQWNMENNNDIDVNACSAWSVTTGDPGIIVAVLDQGVDQSHSEFANNYSSLSYDLVSNSSPSILYGNHGTHVGGIIGANQNGSLISGLAPTSSIMSISDPLTIRPNISAELASGISYAWQNGASVINNSWGDQGGYFYNDLYSSLLENAISDALTLGRNGLGSIVVFAAGNFGGALDYPASSNPDVLAVGSIGQTGVRSSFSAYGNQLDIVAPGEDILSTVPGGLTQPMSGTSMAAPHVAATAALVLSVNPSLTRQQVTNIIEQTAKKVGGYSYTSQPGRPNGTWVNEMGYGLVNAFAAVTSASCNTVYYNNQNVISNTFVGGCSVISGNVTVGNNSILTLAGTQYVVINYPFTVNAGSGLTVTQ